MAPEYLDEFKREFRALRAAQRSVRKSVREARLKRLAELEHEIGHVIDAIAAGLLSPALKAKLEAAESERGKLMNDRGEASDKVAEMLPRLGDTYRELVENLERVPARHMARARVSLKEMIGDVRLIPDDGLKSLIAELSLDGRRLLEIAAGQQINVVAGAGFDLCIDHPLALPIVAASLARIVPEP